MHPDVAAGVLAGGAGLAAEVGRPGHVLEGQRRHRKDLLPVHVGDRDLGGGHQEEVLLLDPEGLLLELGQLPRTGHGGAVEQEGRKELRIPVLPNVEVDHEVDQRPFQPRPRSLQEVEARGRHFHAPLEVQDAQALADLVVRLDGKGRLAIEAPLPDQRVGRRIGPVRHRGIRWVRDLEQQHVQTRVDRPQLLLDRLDLLAQPAHLLDRRLVAAAGQLLRPLVLLGLLAFQVLQPRPALRIEL